LRLWNISKLEILPKRQSMAKVTKLKPREGRAMAAALDTPTDIPAQAVKELSKALNGLLADTFAL